MIKLQARPAMRSALTALGLGLVVAAGLSPAQAHADDACVSVCITDLRADGSNLHVEWTGQDRFAYYHVYWEKEGTVEIRSEKVGADQLAFDIPDAQPGVTYVVQILGCTATTPWYHAGPCGNVDQRTVTT